MKIFLDQNKLIKVLVCGGRTDIDYLMVDRYITDVLSKYDFDDLEFVSGGCKGVDLLGERYAETNGYAITQFLPDWKSYGKAAGIRRNAEMLNYLKDSDEAIVIAFWDGESRGTKYTIENAKKLGFPVYIQYYTKKPMTEGILAVDHGYTFDFSDDTSNDLIPLLNLQMKASKVCATLYYFGYKALSKTQDYNSFVKWLKDQPISGDIKRFVDQYLNQLVTVIDSVDCIVCPISKSGINEYCLNYLVKQYNCSVVRFDKNTPSQIMFDWDSFLASFKGDSEYLERITNYINGIIKQIHKSSRFSLTKQVPPRYRKYFKNFLVVCGDLEIINDCSNVLVLDDIITTSATIQEMLNTIYNIGYKNNIIVSSLINNR